MDRANASLHDAQWVAQCAHRLRERWPHADPTSIEETAIELWADEGLRRLSGIEAAVVWLRLGAIDAQP